MARSHVTKRESQAVVNYVFDDAADYMHGYEHKRLTKRYWRETELMVDHLARFLADTHSLEQAWAEAHKT